MAQAEITINGVSGSDTDLPIGVVVQLNNVNAGGELTYAWFIDDQPAGTLDTLSNPAIQNPTFTPKKEGTYKITLIVNLNLVTEVRDSVVAAVRQLKTGIRIPAATETTQANTSTGWAEDTNITLQRLDTTIADPDIVVAQLGAGTFSAFTCVQFSSVATIKAGLPGEEDILVATPTDATTTGGAYTALGLVISAVSSTLATSSLAYVRRSGLATSVAIAGITQGDDIYLSDTTGLLSRTPGTNRRLVARALSGSGGVGDIMFDGAMQDIDASGTTITWAGDLAGSGNSAQYVSGISGSGGTGGSVPVTATTHLDFGTTPAAAGVIRLSNSTQIAWRNTGGSGDIPLYVDNANNLLLGDQTFVAAARLWGAGSVGMQANNAGYAVHNGTTFDVSAADQTWRAVGGSVVRASVETVYGIVTSGETATSFYASIGPLLTAGNANAALWLLPPGVSRTTGNCAIYADSTNVWINGRTASYIITMSVAGGAPFATWDDGNDRFTTDLTTHRWTELVAPVVTQIARTTDAATNNFTFSVQAPFPTASTNQDPPDLILDLSSPVGGSTTKFGGIVVNRSSTAGTTTLIRAGMYQGGTTYGAIWFHDGGSPGGSNYGFLGNASDTQLNAPSGTLYMLVGNSTGFAGTSATMVLGSPFGAPQYRWDLDATAIFHFGVDATTARIQYDSASAGNPFNIGNTTGVNKLVGGLAKTTRTTATAITLDSNSTTTNVLFVDTTTTALTITLSAPTDGREFILLDEKGTFGTNNVTLARNGSEKINGVAASLVLATDWGMYRIISNGTDWWVG